MKPFLFAIICLGFLFTASAPAAIINVPADQPTIQAALDVSSGGDTVLVQAGIYEGDGNRDLDFGGKAVILTSESGPELTIIDSGGTATDNHRGIHFHNGEGSDSVVNGFTIRGGFAYEGGGILCEDGSPTITNNLITENTVEFRGGGITLHSSCDAVVSGNLVSNNRLISSSGWGNSGGGGLSAEFCSPVISWNRFIGNTCASRGGGLHCLDLDNPVITNNLVAYNTAAMSGGGLNLSTGDTALSISHLTITGNRSLWNGNGVSFNFSGQPLTIDHCIIWSNGDAGEPQLYTSTDATITFTCLEGGEDGINGNGTVIWGAGNLDLDPLLTAGPLGDAFLSQTAAGQLLDSSCVDAGNPAATPPDGTTRTDLAADGVPPDMGFHYPVPSQALLQFAPATFRFTVESGAGNPLPQLLGLWNGGPGTMAWSVSTGTQWLSLSPLSGSSSTWEVDQLTIEVDTSGLGHGHHLGSILVEAPGAHGAPMAIPVEVRIVDTFTVDSAGGGDFQSIQAGIDASFSGDTLLVAPGTYSGAGNRGLDFQGREIELRSTDGPEQTIIDCELQDRAFILSSGETEETVLSGFTIRNGLAGSGGAILCSGESRPTIENNRILDNQATVNGGGLLCEGLSAPRLTGNRFSGNSAVESGGAICTLEYASIHIDDCEFEGNLAGSRGGGVACFDSTALTIINSIFRGNSSQHRGGGIYHDGDNLARIEGNTIEGNSSDSSRGGGINAFSQVDVLIKDNLIDGNSAIHGGGLCTTGRVINNLIINNVAAEDGGGLTTDWHGWPEIESCTFFNNRAGDQGGAIESYDSGFARLRNCILWNNHAPSGHEVYAGDYWYPARLDYCDIDTTSGWSGGDGGSEWGDGNLELQPLWAQGPMGTFYLSQTAAGQPVDSPCVDTGDPEAEMIEGTTRTDGIQDDGFIDIGFHFPVIDGPFICHQPSHFSFGANPGIPPATQPLEIWRCGTGTLGWIISADQSWVLLSPPSGSSTGEVDLVTVGIDPAGLLQGEYQAVITIDTPGRSEPPVEVPVSLTVGRPLIRFGPASFTYSVMVTEPQPPDETLEIWRGGSGVLHWSLEESAAWLTLTPTSGSSTDAHNQVVVDVDHSGLPHGTYEATISIESPNALNSPQMVPVLLVVDEYIISNFPNSFAFAAMAGGPPPPGQMLRIRNYGTGTMSWELSSETEWIHFDKDSGQVGEGVSRILVGVDTALLAPGNHRADIVISAEGATNSPVLVPVSVQLDLDGLVTGPGPGGANPSLVRLYPMIEDASPVIEFTAYGSPHYGVNISVADPDGDGLDEILTGPGPGQIYGPHVRGFEMDGTPLPGLSFLAYGTNTFGVNVTSGNLDNDSFDEIITGAGPGAVFGPQVRAFNYDGTPGVAPVPGVSFMAYGTPKWGVNVAAGDIDGDGFDEIVTGAGPGAVYGPHVRGWNVDGGTAAAIPGVSFLAYGTNKFGVNVTAGDLDGDGMDEIVTGAGPGMVFGPHVRGWNYDGSAITPLPGYSFFAWQTPPLSYGVNVFAGTDLNDNGRDELVAGRGPAPNADTEVKVFTYDGISVNQWLSLEAYPDLLQGTNVAAGRF